MSARESARENNMSHIDRRTISLLGLAAILSPLRTLAAESYPSRPIRLIVGFTAGATSDIIARIFAKAADPLLGQNVVVENKPGVGSSIAAEYVARSVNDGYTLFVPTLSTLTDEIVNPDRSTHLDKDFSPIALLGSIAIVLIVAPNANVHSVSELIALAKSKPGGVTYVVAGRITMLFAPASSIIGQVKSGKVLALATAADKRSSALPEVPTMAEAGMPDFDTSLWLGLAGPAGLPRSIVDKLAGPAQKAMQAPDSAAVLVKQGYDPHFLGPDQFAAFIVSEKARWSAVASAAGLLSKS